MAEKWTADIRVDPGYRRLVTKRWLSKMVINVLAAEQARPGAKLSLVITGDATVRKLNKMYRGLDKTTDVLSFPLVEEGTVFISAPEEPEHLGEVVISFPQARRQAERMGHPVEKELALLIIHGVLHVLGYDHLRPAERRVMRAREQVLLSQLAPESMLQGATLPTKSR